MSVVPHLEFCRRQDNVIYLPPFRSHVGSQGVREVENAEEKMCDPAADPHTKVAAILWQDSALMVGG
jgi:hypothetical protein